MDSSNADWVRSQVGKVRSEIGYKPLQEQATPARPKYEVYISEDARLQTLDEYESAHGPITGKRKVDSEIQVLGKTNDEFLDIASKYASTASTNNKKQNCKN